MQQTEDTSQAIRMILLVIGAGIGLAGMATNTSWLVYGALAILALGGVVAIIRRIKIRRSES